VATDELANFSMKSYLSDLAWSVAQWLALFARHQTQKVVHSAQRLVPIARFSVCTGAHGLCVPSAAL
jgi:hypothetical protein